VLLLSVWEQRATGQLARVRGPGGLAVALLPVADQVRVEHAGPAHPALEEGEVQVREAARHPAEEERLAHGVAGGGEVADMVVAEVRRRVAQEDPAAARMAAPRAL